MSVFLLVQGFFNGPKKGHLAYYHAFLPIIFRGCWLGFIPIVAITPNNNF
jgi:hypothetical protein